jgi:hypothetical protein
MSPQEHRSSVHLKSPDDGGYRFQKTGTKPVQVQFRAPGLSQHLNVAEGANLAPNSLSCRWLRHGIAAKYCVMVRDNNSLLA